MVHVKRQAASIPLVNGLIVGAAERTLELERANGDVTVVLTDDSQMHELNRQYLHVDAPTDVLSFPSGETDPETGAMYLGDVVISIPRALAQAATAGHDLEAEVQLLVVHGVLHLLGYDHAEPRGKAEMWSAQNRALMDLGLAGIVIQE